MNKIQRVTKEKGSFLPVFDKIMPRKMALIESDNNELKNIAQLEAPKVPRLLQIS